ISETKRRTFVEPGEKRRCTAFRYIVLTELVSLAEERNEPPGDNNAEPESDRRESGNQCSYGHDLAIFPFPRAPVRNEVKNCGVDSRQHDQNNFDAKRSIVVGLLGLRCK